MTIIDSIHDRQHADELREALAEVVDLALDDYRPIYNEAGQCVDSHAADALLAGPVGDLLVERDQALATLKAVREYADEREAYGRRGRTVHSIRIASDLRRILDGADTERPEPTDQGCGR